MLRFLNIYKKDLVKLNQNLKDLNKKDLCSHYLRFLANFINNYIHPKVLEELLFFYSRSSYLSFCYTIEIKDFIEGINFASKIDKCFDVLQKIVKNRNFDVTVREQILNKMYLFQKDRIHEFEDFLNNLQLLNTKTSIKRIIISPMQNLPSVILRSE